MRGTHAWFSTVGFQFGIIPAHAGNTYILSLPMLRYRDHPRACGEHNALLLTLKTAMGSSPRMRGTLERIHGRCRLRGIIPAHAGNTVYVRR